MRTAVANTATVVSIVLGTLSTACEAVDSSAAPEGVERQVSQLRLAAVPTVDELLLEAGFQLPAPTDAVARAVEVRDYLAAGYFADHAIISTTQTLSGQTVDWVDPRDLDPEFDQRTPPPLAATHNLKGGANDLSVLPSAPFARDPGFVGPGGTVPLVRPDLGFYIAGGSPERSVQRFVASIPRAQPGDVTHLYGGYQQALATPDILGTEAWMNYFDIAQVTGTDMSLAQLSIASCGTTGNAVTESVEFGLQKNPTLYHDDALHYFVYFTTNGYASEGNYVGGYNTSVLGFVPWKDAPFTAGATVGGPYAAIDGTQYERRLRIVRFDGAYWIQDWVSDTANTWLGYFPFGTNDDQIKYTELNTGGCRSSVYGETADDTSTDWTDADMGSGRFAAEEFGKAAYFRNIRVESTSGTDWFPTTANMMGPVDAACYTVTAVTDGDGEWERFFYYGGPGGDAMGCN